LVGWLVGVANKTNSKAAKQKWVKSGYITKWADKQNQTIYTAAKT
jgi:hypothetical protein